MMNVREILEEYQYSGSRIYQKNALLDWNWENTLYLLLSLFRWKTNRSSIRKLSIKQQLKRSHVYYTNFIIGIKYKVMSDTLNGWLVWWMKYISNRLLFKIWWLGDELHIFHKAIQLEVCSFVNLLARVKVHRADSNLSLPSFN